MLFIWGPIASAVPIARRNRESFQSPSRSYPDHKGVFVIRPLVDAADAGGAVVVGGGAGGTLGSSLRCSFHLRGAVVLLLIGLASATCTNPCDGLEGGIRWEVSGAALTLVGSATTLGMLIPPAFLVNHQEVGASWVGLSTLPLEASGPLVLWGAGEVYRRELKVQGIKPVVTPWYYVGWASTGVGLATSLGGLVQGFDKQPAGPILQVAAIPLFITSAVAFQRDSAALRAQLGPVSMGPSLAPVAWSNPDSSGLGLAGRF